MVLNCKSVGLDWTSGNNVKIPFNPQAGQSVTKAARGRGLQDFRAFEPCRHKVHPRLSLDHGTVYPVVCVGGSCGDLQIPPSEPVIVSLRGRQVLSRLQFATSGPHWTTVWRRHKLQLVLGRLVLRAKLNSLPLPCFQHPACALALSQFAQGCQNSLQAHTLHS